MEIKIQVGGNKKAGILSQITHFIFGVFLTSMIFTTYMKFWEESGIVFAFATTIILSFLAYYKSKRNTFLRRATWGMIITLLAIIIAYFSILYVFENAYEGFNSN